jgi:siderophore synthetase component
MTVNPSDLVQHLQPSIWSSVNGSLVAKALAEFSHELLLAPETVEDGLYAIRADDPNIEYRFRARVFQLDHWHIERASVRKYDHGRDARIEAERFVAELQQRLAIPADVLPEYLLELSCTLFAAAYKRAAPALSARELACADFQVVEAAMTEGHPVFVANNARLGFNAADYRAYAPEVRESTSLVWLAARRNRVDIGCIEGLTYDEHIRSELGDATLDEYCSAIRTHGCDPAGYAFIPVHPWQWENRIQQLFAGDLACADLIYLGPGSERYQPQQSVRTLFNLTHPGSCYVKTALSILNMGFTRGMPSAIADSAAAVNDWVAGIVSSDPHLRECGFSLLREVAYVGYRHRYYEKVSHAKHEPYKEMLAALWRESPVPLLEPGERLMTMAALLHVDAGGDSLLAALIRASGVPVDDWIRAYLGAYLRPLLHCFYAHKLTFTPHCENVILVLKDDVPARIFIKDLAEDVGVLNPEGTLPPRVQRLALKVPEDLMTLVIFTDVFDCVFRFLAPILAEHAGCPAERFWLLVAECIQDYQCSFPMFAERFERYDLFAAAFPRNCLNRLQLRNNRLMVDLNAPEPADSLQFAGTLRNPIAGFRDGSAVDGAAWRCP